MNPRPAVLAVLLVLSLLAVGCAGQRLIEVQIEKDGEQILQSQFGISNETRPNASWSQLETSTFKAVGHLQPDAGTPNATLLKGKIRILLRHAGSHYASADVEQLRLTLVPGTEDKWTIPRDEVERTLKVAAW